MTRAGTLVPGPGTLSPEAGTKVRVRLIEERGDGTSVPELGTEVPPQFSISGSIPSRTIRFWRIRAVRPQIWRLPMW